LLEFDNNCLTYETELFLSKLIFLADLHAAKPQFEMEVKHLHACLSSYVFFCCQIVCNLDLSLFLVFIESCHAIAVSLFAMGEDTGMGELFHHVDGCDGVHDGVAGGCFLGLEDESGQVDRAVVFYILLVAFFNPLLPQNLSRLEQLLILLLQDSELSSREGFALKIELVPEILLFEIFIAQFAIV
jgi:hypothetical protein